MEENDDGSRKMVRDDGSGWPQRQWLRRRQPEEEVAGRKIVLWVYFYIILIWFIIFLWLYSVIYYYLYAYFLLFELAHDLLFLYAYLRLGISLGLFAIYFITFMCLFLP